MSACARPSPSGAPRRDDGPDGRRSADDPGAPADVLAQPTRARIVALLRGARSARTTDDLAAALDLHPNGVRLHLDRLRRAGLVERTRPRTGEGRPRDVWSLTDAAMTDDDGAYVDLSRWMTRLARAGASTPAAAELAGRTIGRELTPEAAPASDPDLATAGARMQIALRAMGFRPHELPARAPEWRFRLDRCPYREAVDDPDRLVCALHRGITQGLLDGISPGGEVVAFRPEDPRQAGCLVGLRAGTPPHPAHDARA